MEEKYISIRQKPWKDLEDNDHIYRNGDIYPREGLEPSKGRIKELTTNKNKIGEILIKKVEIEKKEQSEGNEQEEIKEQIEEIKQVEEEEKQE